MSEKIKKPRRTSLRGRHSKIAAVLGLILALVAMYGLTPLVKAAVCPKRSDTLSDPRPSTASNHTVKFKTPTGVDASTDTITLTFAAGFTMGSVAFGDMDLEIDAACDGTYETSKTLAASAAAGTWGVSVSGQVITFTAPTDAASGEIAADSCVMIEIGTNAEGGTNQITNPSKSAAAGTADIHDIDIGGTFGDTGKIKVAIIEGVTVSATVAETLSFTISDVSIGFGTWSGTEIRWATADESGATAEPAGGEPSQLTVSSNASGGVGISIKDEGDGTSAGLYSTSVSKLIAAVASSAVAAGSEGYGIYGKAATGLTIDEGFDNDGTSDLAITRSAQTFASSTGPVSSAVVDVTPKAAIAGTTPAASDYADTLILVCTPTY